MRRLALGLALLAVGCGGGTIAVDGGADQARPSDLAGVDLAGSDLAAPADLASPDDLAVGPDFAGVDLAGYSDVGGPCGGFTANPKMCLPGLVCVANMIPDLPGTCERPDGG
jgi:hypothetical protein